MKTLLLIGVLWAGACSLEPDSSFGSIDPAARAQWVEKIKGKTYKGNPNLFGGGAFAEMTFAFDSEGNLHNQVPLFDNNKWFSLHRLVFLHGEGRASVVFYKSASPKQQRQVYALEVREDGLYRTQNIVNQEARGYTAIDTWTGLYSTENLQKIADLHEDPAPDLTVPDPNS